MTENVAIGRKIAYVCAIGLLLIPLSLLGRPSATSKNSAEGSRGGLLAEIRDENGLSQASLGDIDPASETMKLATLGLKGVAVTYLWHKANEFKERDNWDGLSASLEQIIKLQPNFIKVWEHQAHNLSYNVSVEFDDYQARYLWVKRGCDFLMEGLSYNRRDYRILRNLGQFFGLKMGRADERFQFRRMFRRDVDYHEKLADHLTNLEEAKTTYGLDNWLTAGLWYNLAEGKVRKENVPLTTSHLMFYKEAPQQIRSSAVDLEEEFRPDEYARQLWEKAYAGWDEYGNKSLKTSWDTYLRLNDKEVYADRVKELRAELDAMVPGAREQLIIEARKQLTPEEARAIEIDPLFRSDEEAYRAKVGSQKLLIDDAKIAAMSSEENRSDAYRLDRQIKGVEEEYRRIMSYRDQVNYEYWYVRAKVERSDEQLAARQWLWDANLLNDQKKILDEEVVDPVTNEKSVVKGAKSLFEQSFAAAAEIIKKNPQLADSVMIEETVGEVVKYERLLQELGQEMPQDFPLNFLVARNNRVSESDRVMEEGTKQTPPTGTRTPTSVNAPNVPPPDQEKKTSSEPEAEKAEGEDKK